MQQQRKCVKISFYDKGNARLYPLKYKEIGRSFTVSTINYTHTCTLSRMRVRV
jgi:hypothetical protein